MPHTSLLEEQTPTRSGRTCAAAREEEAWIRSSGTPACWRELSIIAHGLQLGAKLRNHLRRRKRKKIPLQSRICDTDSAPNGPHSLIALNQSVRLARWNLV